MNNIRSKKECRMCITITGCGIMTFMFSCFYVKEDYFLVRDVLRQLKFFMYWLNQKNV